ncbi:MAG: hypothetical protein KGI70_00735 [Patescibacteria group bacterium]|nr:hypothetical protein [Patescibacteria group bacterium]
MPIFFNALALLSALTVGFLYWHGVQDALFWKIGTYYIILHVLGGFAVGSWVSAGLWRLRAARDKAPLRIMLAALAVGVAWEIFEFITGLSWPDPHYLTKTTGDLLCDVTGGLVAALLYGALRSYLYE